MCPIKNIFFAYKTNRLRQESVKRILLKIRLKMTRLLFLGVILHADRIELELKFFRRGSSDSLGEAFLSPQKEERAPADSDR